MSEFIDNQSVVVTDKFKSYSGVKNEHTEHKVINLWKIKNMYGETNGIYQHVSKQHLFRYVNEFDFRYNLRKVNDTERTITAIRGAIRKRLMYKESIPTNFYVFTWVRNEKRRKKNQKKINQSNCIPLNQTYPTHFTIRSWSSG